MMRFVEFAKIEEAYNLQGIPKVSLRCASIGETLGVMRTDVCPFTLPCWSVPSSLTVNKSGFGFKLVGTVTV